MKKAEQKIPAVSESERHEPSAFCVTGYVGWFDTPDKGRGGVALCDIKAGTIIDRNPVIVMPNVPLLDKEGNELLIENYLFRWGPEEDQMAAESVCAVGFIPLLNHAEEPNADTIQNHEQQLLELVALRDIQKGEEITINYDTDLWFDVKP